MRVSESQRRVHERDAKYSVPAGVLHYSEVLSHRFHSTLFSFDAGRGFVPDAGVIGPIDGNEYTVHCGPSTVTARSLAGMADAVRSWEKGKCKRMLYGDEDPQVLRLYEELDLGCSR